MQGGVSLGPEERLKVGVGVLKPNLRKARGGGVVCEQRRRWEQFVPANDNVAEVKVIQQDLSHAHEDFLVHATVIPPYRHLEWGERSVHETQTWLN